MRMSVSPAIVMLVVSEDFTDSDLEVISERTNQIVGEDVNVTYEFVDNILVEKSGKIRRVVISKI